MKFFKQSTPQLTTKARLLDWLETVPEMHLTATTLPAIAQRASDDLGAQVSTITSYLVELYHSGKMIRISGNQSKGDYEYDADGTKEVPVHKISKHKKKITVKAPAQKPENVEVKIATPTACPCKKELTVPVKVEKEGKNLSITINLNLSF